MLGRGFLPLAAGFMAAARLTFQDPVGNGVSQLLTPKMEKINHATENER